MENQFKKFNSINLLLSPFILSLSFLLGSMALSYATPIKSGIIFIKNDPSNPIYTIEVYKNEPGSNTQNSVATLPGGKKPVKINLSVEIGDWLYFNIPKCKQCIIDPYQVQTFNQTYQIEIDLPLKDSKFNLKPAPNTTASLSSFDILHLNPLMIVQGKKQGGGMMQEIFEPLDELDVDWTRVGDYAISDFFQMVPINEGRGSTVASSAYSAQSFSQSIGVEIGMDASVAEFGGNLSVGFENMTGGKSSRKDAYTYAKRQEEAYSLDLKLDKVKLNENFKDAVLDLPIPKKFPRNLQDAKKSNVLKKYKKFISNWGTHFPTQVIYGGSLFIYTKSTLQHLVNEQSNGVNVKAGLKGNIEGVELGGNIGVEYKKSSKTTHDDNNTTSGYVRIGGKGDPEHWTLGDDVAPININLSRIDELFSGTLFQDMSLAEELGLRRKLMEWALTDYIGSAIDNGKSLRPRVFEMQVNNWTMLDNPWGAGNEETVYGTVTASLFKIDPKAGPIELSEKKVWNTAAKNYVRIKQGGRVNFAQTTISANRTITFVVNPENGKMPNLNEYQFFLHAELLNNRPTGPYWCYGNKTISKPFSELTLNPNQPFSITFDSEKCDKQNFANAGDGWKFSINAVTYEKSLESLGFDYYPNQK